MSSMAGRVACGLLGAAGLIALLQWCVHRDIRAGAPSTPDDDDPLDNPRSAGDADGDIG